MKRTGRRLLAGLLLVLVAVVVQRFWKAPDETGSEAGPSDPAAESGAEAMARAFREKVSGIVVESSGTVVRTLPDDEEGSRHQRILVRLEGGQTVLIAHNIDLAARVPVSTGDVVRFRGQYEWNERGGVVHWTHHDPQGRRPGGWIRRGDRTYE